MPAAALQNRRLFIYYLLFGLLFLARTSFAEDAALRNALDGITTRAAKGTVLAVHLVDLKSGEEVYAKNAELPLKPASTMKILTTSYALDKLGPEHYFLTPFLIVKSDTGAATLYVKGMGDPYMTTEFLWIAARRVKKLGVDKLEQIVIDDGAFREPPSRQGQRAYMTGASAMSFNFNSVNIEICPGVVGQHAEVSIEPLEAPIKIFNSAATVSKGGTDLDAVERASDVKGSLAAYEVRGKINRTDSCKVITRSMSRPAEFFAYTLEGFLKYLGIKIEKKFSFGAYPDSSGSMFTQATFPLSYVTKGLNHYSTNFIAEQIVYALGADASTKTFDRERGLSRLFDFLAEIGLNNSQFKVYDGSGLSHDNRLSASALTKILSYAYSKIGIRNEFISSLPIAGVSGTLRKRNFDTSNAMIRAKTGSLDGVNTLAGYIFSNKQKQYAFAIIQNNSGSRDAALALEEKIIDTITGQ